MNNELQIRPQCLPTILAMYVNSGWRVPAIDRLPQSYWMDWCRICSLLFMSVLVARAISRVGAVSPAVTIERREDNPAHYRLHAVANASRSL